LRAAALSLRSARYMRINGELLPPVWDPLSDFYPVRDGWLRTHCNFPNHREAALKVLQAPPDRRQAQVKASAWTGEALEDAIHAAGGCAGFVRTAADWARHAQAEAVAAQPLIEITRIGDAPPERPRTAKRPLVGIRVLDLTRALAALRPGIVCVSLSAWGETGPWRARRGFDSIVQSVSGMAHASGDAAAPKLMPVSAIDYVSGYLMAFGATVALARRAREGGSW